MRDIRTCESLDEVAERIVAKEDGQEEDNKDDEQIGVLNGHVVLQAPTFESQLYGKMGDLRLDEGSVRYIGGTSNLIHLGEDESLAPDVDEYLQQEDPITSWTTVTDDPELVLHLLNMYFTWLVSQKTARLACCPAYQSVVASRTPRIPKCVLGRSKTTPVEHHIKALTCSVILISADT